LLHVDVSFKSLACVLLLKGSVLPAKLVTLRREIIDHFLHSMNPAYAYFRYRHTRAYAMFQVQTHHGLRNISGTDTPRLTQYFRYRHTTAYAIFPFRMDGAIRILPKSELSVHLVNYARMYKGIQMKSKLKHTALTFVNFQLDAQNSLFIYLYTIHLLKSSTCFEQYAAHLQEVYVVIASMQPLISSLSVGDCPVHRLRKFFLNP